MNSFNRLKTLLKRNIKEMFRDPIIYIFCGCFPIFMILLFTLINKYTNGTTPVFSLRSLIPGILVFSYTFTMLIMSLLVSKDFTKSLLKRLFISPLKGYEFILGYATVGLILTTIQSILCITCGYFVSLAIKDSYFSITASLILIIEYLPIAIINIFMGILFGTILNDNAAPGISSIFITASGILGGCWMPLETMGNFETFARFLPFYPSVLLGRVTTNAYNIMGNLYTFQDINYSIITIIVWFVVVICLAIFAFSRKMIRK